MTVINSTPITEFNLLSLIQVLASFPNITNSLRGIHFYKPPDGSISSDLVLALTSFQNLQVRISKLVIEFLSWLFDLLRLRFSAEFFCDESES